MKADPACRILRFASVLPALTDGSLPPAGFAFYYLVSGRSFCGEGTLGSSTPGSPRPNPSPCP